MNQYEREQVDKICIAWIRYETSEWIHDIAKEGKNMLGEKGVFGGGEKPDTMGPKIDKAQDMEEELEFMRYALEVFRELDVVQKWILLAAPYNALKHKQDKARHPLKKPRELAEYVGMTYDQYRDRLRTARAKVLRIDRQLRPYVYEKQKIGLVR